MENLEAMADSRYTGFREITDRDVLDLQFIYFFIKAYTVGTHLNCLDKSR